MVLHCFNMFQLYFFFASLKYDLLSVFQVALAEVSKTKGHNDRQKLGETCVCVCVFFFSSIIAFNDQLLLGSNTHKHDDMKQIQEM